MNVIIANKLKDNLSTVNIPLGKTLIGYYLIDDIVNSFVNFECSKLIIDMSAIKDKDNLVGFQKMAASLDMQNVIFVVGDNNDNELITKIIPFGIYNFANNPSGVVELVNKPNTYKDVAHYHDLSNIKNPATTAMRAVGSTRIIGFKNITKSAGATTLIYLSKLYLEKMYKVLVVEVGKNDFSAYRVDNVVSTTEDNFTNTINEASDYDIILVDINTFNVEAYCSDVLYLIEPSIVKLGILERTMHNFAEKLRGQKIVLNKSFLRSSELSSFEFEGKIKVYFNLPTMNDRANKNEHIVALYNKLGFNKRDARKTKRS
jgi:hypothetical protein